MNRTVALYQRALKKKLPCQGGVQQRLLDQFGVMLDGFLEENPSPTAEELYAAFGPPEEMAAQLSASISDEEAKQYTRSKIAKRVIAAVLAVVMLLFTVYILFYKEKPLNSVDEILPTESGWSETLVP